MSGWYAPIAYRLLPCRLALCCAVEYDDAYPCGGIPGTYAARATLWEESDR
jgi:hypothetical protein